MEDVAAYQQYIDRIRRIIERVRANREAKQLNRRNRNLNIPVSCSTLVILKCSSTQNRGYLDMVLLLREWLGCFMLSVLLIRSVVLIAIYIAPHWTRSVKNSSQCACLGVGQRLSASPLRYIGNHATVLGLPRLSRLLR